MNGDCKLLLWLHHAAVLTGDERYLTKRQLTHKLTSSWLWCYKNGPGGREEAVQSHASQSRSSSSWSNADQAPRWRNAASGTVKRKLSSLGPPAKTLLQYAFTATYCNYLLRSFVTEVVILSTLKTLETSTHVSNFKPWQGTELHLCLWRKWSSKACFRKGP